MENRREMVEVMRKITWATPKSMFSVADAEIDRAAVGILLFLERVPEQIRAVAVAAATAWSEPLSWKERGYYDCPNPAEGVEGRYTRTRVGGSPEMSVHRVDRAPLELRWEGPPPPPLTGKLRCAPPTPEELRKMFPDI